jgi:hypothetical protein
MPLRRIFPLIAAISCVIVSVAAPARAEENLLRGPHPFRKENQLSAHVLIGSGHGDSMSGTKFAFDYNYKLTGVFTPLWLDLGVNGQLGGCAAAATAPGCSYNTGDVFETFGGVKWTFATPIPLVPYAGASGGLVFAFPNSASAAMGLMIRAVGGVNYFVFDWLGGGVQLGYSLGAVGYDSTFGGSHTYAILDVGGGVVVQF